VNEPRRDCRYFNKGACTKQSRMYCVELGICGAYDKKIHRPVNPCHGMGGGACKKSHPGCKEHCHEWESYLMQRESYEKYNKAEYQIGNYVCETGKALVKKKNDA